MASMLGINRGEPIGYVCEGKGVGRYIGLTPQEGEDELIRLLSTEVQLPDSEVQVAPSQETERMYIAGQSGCGKSTLAAQYARKYMLMFPDRRVFLFSRHENEPTYKNVPHTAIELSEELFDQPVELTELANSLVIFDDTDNMQNKKVAKAMQRLNDDIISNGRKYNIHCITLAHQLLNHFKSRNLLNEANRVIFFNNGTGFHVKNYLQKYVGLDIANVRRIIALPTRWTLISLGMPMYILYQHGAFLLNTS